MAVRIPKVKHIVSIGSKKYSAMLPDIYQNFGSLVGVTKAPTPDNTVYEDKLGNDDYSQGRAIKLKSRGTTGSGTTKKSRDFTIVVPVEKLANAIGSIGSKQVTYDSKTYDLGDARIPTRRRFS